MHQRIDVAGRTYASDRIDAVERVNAAERVNMAERIDTAERINSEERDMTDVLFGGTRCGTLVTSFRPPIISYFPSSSFFTPLLHVLSVLLL